MVCNVRSSWFFSLVMVAFSLQYQISLDLLWFMARSLLRVSSMMVSICLRYRYPIACSSLLLSVMPQVSAISLISRLTSLSCSSSLATILSFDFTSYCNNASSSCWCWYSLIASCRLLFMACRCDTDDCSAWF